MPDQDVDREGCNFFSILLTVLEYIFVIGLFGYPLYGLITGHLLLPSKLDGLHILNGVEARVMASGMLLLFVGWAAIIRRSEANRKTWNPVGYVLMAIGIIGMIASIIFATPS